MEHSVANVVQQLPVNSSSIFHALFILVLPLSSRLSLALGSRRRRTRGWLRCPSWRRCCRQPAGASPVEGLQWKRYVKDEIMDTRCSHISDEICKNSNFVFSCSAYFKLDISKFQSDFEEKLPRVPRSQASLFVERRSSRQLLHDWKTLPHFAERWGYFSASLEAPNRFYVQTKSYHLPSMPLDKDFSYKFLPKSHFQDHKIYVRLNIRSSVWTACEMRKENSLEKFSGCLLRFFASSASPSIDNSPEQSEERSTWKN